MSVLPEPPAATAAGQASRNTAIEAQADQLLAAMNAIAAEQPTHYRDDTKPPQYGTTPPVPQPGRPPMSQGAVDASTLMLSGSVLTATVGGATTAILWASGHADPAVIAAVFGAPAVFVLALARLAKRAKGVLPEQHIHQYEGTVYQDQRNVHSSTRGVWAKTNNTQ